MYRAKEAKTNLFLVKAHADMQKLLKVGIEATRLSLARAIQRDVVKYVR